MRFFFSLFLLCAVITARGQKYLIPYLADGLYGLADEEMNILIPPEYERISFDSQKGIIVAQKSGSWCILNVQGKPIVPCSSNQLEVTTAYGIDYNNPLPSPIPGLYQISDRSTRRKYYFNSHLPLTPLTPFANVEDVRKGRNTIYNYSPNNNSPWNEMMKVATLDQRINFLDSSANVIFPENVYDGWVISKHFIAIDDGSGKYALFSSKAAQLTEFSFNHIRRTPNSAFVICIVGSEQDRHIRYHLLDINGHTIVSNLTDVIPLDDQNIILTDSLGSSLHAYDGRPRFSFPGRRISLLNDERDYLHLGGQSPFQTRGIIDIHGKIVLDTICELIALLPNGRYACNHESGSVVYDSSFSKQFAVDSFHITGEILSSDESLPGYYLLLRKDGYRRLYGVIDSVGNIVIKPRYRFIKYARSCHLFLVGTDTGSVILDFAGGELATSGIFDAYMMCKDDQMWIQGDSSIRYYDRNGVFQKEINRHVVPNPPPQREIILKDRNGTIIPQSAYDQIFSNTDEKGKRAILIGRKSNKSEQFVSLFNEKGIEITPDEYGLPRNNAHSKTGINGSIVIFHKEDVLSRKDPFRSGVIDFDGEWILPPSLSKIQILGNELFVLYDPQNSAATIYDRYGKKISEKNYDFFENDVNDIIHHDRIVVGYITDKEEYLKARSKLLDEQDLIQATRRLSEQQEVRYKKGYINSFGNEVISAQYLYAEPFQYKYTTVTGIDDKGSIYSSVIDLNGKTILKTPYERLKLFSYDSTLMSAMKNNNYGVVDLQGKVIIDPAYERIDLSEIPSIYIAEDTTAKYVIGTAARTKLNSGRLEIKKLTDSYFYITQTYKEEGASEYIKSYHIFGTDGTYYGDVSSYMTDRNGAYISASLFENKLPEGYIAIMPGKQQRPFVISIKTLAAFRKL